jgi:3'-phosphoadenosine 5'-phosphosulfate sulfotransferase (PAPS reductase)/FAD synthetase
MLTTEKFVTVKPHPKCISFTRKMLAKFKDVPPFDASKVAIDLSVPDLDLRSYDHIIINTSGGKDSQNVMRQMVALAEVQGVKDRCMAVHCDLQSVEWFGVKELVKAQACYYDLPLHFVKRPQGDLLQNIRERGMFPGAGTRYCTAGHKRGQVLKLFTLLARRIRESKFRKAKILNVMGHRAEESCEREQLLPFNENWKVGQISNSRRQIDIVYPIHHWSLPKVWDEIRLSCLPRHYAYDLGMPRLSCAFCVFAPRNALMIAGYYNPELLDRYCEVEQEIGHRFKKSLPIISIRTALQNGERAKMSEDWKM